LETEPEYLKDLNCRKAEHTINNENIQIHDEFSYSELMGKLEPYVSAAKRHPQIQLAFSEFFSKVRLSEFVPNCSSAKIQDPPTIKISGKKVTKPSLNFPYAGAQRKYKKYHCSICGQSGHNAASCRTMKHD
jgi:hypothetical protein